MRTTALKVLAAAAVMLTLVGAAQAQALSKVERMEQQRFAKNNSLFVLYHEVAHLIFDQLDLPILGREEDAADNMASWMLLNQQTPQAEAALTDAARGWQLSGRAYNSGGYESDFYAAHSLDRQRSFQIVCLMVGSDVGAFRPIANEYHLDRDRQDSCYFDWETVDRSFSALLGVGRKAKHVGTEVTVSYHNVSGRLKSAADAFRSSRVFERVAEDLRTRFSLPKPVAFNAKRCGEANAFYDRDNVEVIFCYELMQDYMDLWLADHQAAVAESSAGKKRK